MTALTGSEIKTILFALFFVALLGAFMGLYSQSPIPSQKYTGNTSTSNQTTATSDAWISGLLPSLPEPFNDPIVAIVTGIIIIPVGIMLSYISIRAIKDLISQWV